MPVKENKAKLQYGGRKNNSGLTKIGQRGNLCQLKLELVYRSL